MARSSQNPVQFLRKAAFVAACTVFLGGTVAGAPPAGVNVVTFHYDNLRTGWNPGETALTPTTVQHGSGGATFKMTSFTNLDGQVDAQPLIVTGETIQTKGVHDVVYVATENNTLYAIDANTGAILRERHFNAPVPVDALPGGCGNNSGVVGIEGTPVIDAANNVMYLVAYVYANNAQKYELHEINLTTLADVVPRVLITASGKLANGHTYKFNPAVSRQRAAMLLSGGNVYVGFASFCDIAADQARGWVLGWNAGTLAPLPANELTNTLASSPDNYYLTSIWMSGAGLAANANGDVFFVTGNSDYSGTTISAVNNVAESTVQVSADLTTVKSVFTPDNAVSLENEDGDFGSGGVMLLPPQTGQASNTAVAAGKDGNMYFLNADNLNNNTTGENRILGTYGIGGCWCGESYFTGHDGVGHVVASGGNSVTVWVEKSGAHPKLVSDFSSAGISGDQDPGFFTAVSSNGTTAGTTVIWAISHPDSSNGDSISLYAFNANSGATVFSGVAGHWVFTGGNANLAPVAANGHVYVGSYEGLAIYGLSSGPAATPTSFSSNVLPRIALAPGQHEIFGTVRAIDGWTATIARRDGSLVKVDMLAAAQTGKFAQPRVGHGILVRGKYTAMNAMAADIVMHAKDRAGMWQSDR
ncbi:MAG TPA: hypothetical protein VHU87_11145 [Rhizomicrobium sp.]|nr:hypothetical protein [Rhizomicrobium sp.]